MKFSVGGLYMPIVLKNVTEKSLSDKHTIILLEFVLSSDHSMYVVMIISAPSTDSDAAEVDRLLFRIASAVSDCATVVADSKCSKCSKLLPYSILEFSSIVRSTRDAHEPHVDIIYITIIGNRLFYGSMGSRLQIDR